MTRDELEDQVQQIAQGLSLLQDQLSKLAPRIAKGTRDVTIAANAVTEEALESRIERALRHEPLTERQLARTVAATAPELPDILRALEKDKKIYNLGSQEHAIWTWRIGDQTSAADLMNCVRKLISSTPLTTRELTAATGARYTRVDGAIIALRRSEPADRMLNMGVTRAARWFLIPNNAMSATLKVQGR